mmetsp:Transcript_19200/g.29573  ORF Transcript_19200/g.29573 Transcript_19200/m.29573 type:complete len:114 (-) Transcript_19200:599-940(-)
MDDSSSSERMSLTKQLLLIGKCCDCQSSTVCVSTVNTLQNIDICDYKISDDGAEPMDATSDIIVVNNRRNISDTEKNCISMTYWWKGYLQNQRNAYFRSSRQNPGRKFKMMFQ